MSGWLELFQFPLDSQNAARSRTATLMWYALGKIQAVASLSVRVSAQAWVKSPARVWVRPATVSASVWSAVGFLGGWSSTSWTCLPGKSASTALSAWAEVKSYSPTVSDVVVPARKSLSVAQPVSGLADRVRVASASTGSRVTPGGPL